MTAPRVLHEKAEGTGAPTVVFVPGLDGTALLFYRQVPLLARRFNVAAFPLPDDPDASMADLVSDLEELIDEVASGEVILCGESFGGALSMRFALDHPDRLAGLVVVNSFPYVRGRLQIHLAPTLLRLVPWGTMALMRRFTESRLHSPHALPEDLAEFHERAKAIGREGYIQRLEILRRYDIRDRLHEIRVPTLYLAADRDQLVDSVDEAKYMAERVPDATLRVLEGYGHVCLINHDLDLLDYVGPWYGRQERKRESAAQENADPEAR